MAHGSSAGYCKSNKIVLQYRQIVQWCIMKAIVVVDKHWGIGRDGGLLFRLKKDMAYFRAATLHKTVVMGANTYRSFPHGALPDRVNIVLDDSGKRYDDATGVCSVEELDAQLAHCPTDDVYVIGGASVYRLLLDRCSEVYVTKVDADGRAQLFFPDLDELPDWVLVEQGEPVEDNGYTIRFCRYAHLESDGGAK